MHLFSELLVQGSQVDLIPGTEVKLEGCDLEACFFKEVLIRLSQTLYKDHLGGF